MTFPRLPDELERAGPTRHRVPRPSLWRRFFEMPTWAWYAIAAVFFALTVAILVLKQPDPVPRTAAGAPVVPSTPTITVQAPPPPGDLPEGAFAGDDREQFYVVGLEVDPGTYTSAGPVDPEVAGRWEVYRSPSWSRDRDGTSVGPVTVELRRGQVFHTAGFKPWHRGP